MSKYRFINLTRSRSGTSRSPRRGMRVQEDDACVENRRRDGKATAAGRRGSEREGERERERENGIHRFGGNFRSVR